MAFGLARFDLTTLTRPLALPEISADPDKPITLILRFCGIGNRDWEVWRFARDAAAGAVDNAKKPTGQRFTENRADLRDCLAAISLVGWENVLEDGQPVVFGAAAAARFVAELHDMVPATLARIGDWAATRSNFRTGVSIDPTALGKDAPRG